MPAPQPLPHRQEAFARHVASGRSLTDAARLAGYAWDSARQTGSRLMKEPHIAARAADLAHASDNQRQGELDELVSALKRLMIDTMARENDFAALRAIDMIARLRGLVPTTAKRSDGLETALEEMRQQPSRRTRKPSEEADPGPDPGSRVRPADAARTAAAGRTRSRPRTPPSPAQIAPFRHRSGPRRRSPSPLLLRAPDGPAPRAIRQNPGPERRASIFRRRRQLASARALAGWHPPRHRHHAGNAPE